jgi:hypothetical protein
MSIEYDGLIPIDNIRANFKSLKHDTADEHALETTKQALAKQELKIRILLLTDNNNDDSRVIEEMERLLPRKGNWEMKILELKDRFGFVMIDFREVWIPLHLENGNIEKSKSLVTDSKAVVALAKYIFEALWNDPKAKTLSKHPTKHNTSKKHHIIRLSKQK